VVRVEDIPRTRIGKHRLLVQHLDISSYLGAAHIDDEESALS
jgi:phenylacetate-CoA ligase